MHFRAGNRYSLPVPRNFQQALSGFYQQFYHAGQMSLSLVGPQTANDLKALAQRCGAQLRPDQSVPQLDPPTLMTDAEHAYLHLDGQWLRRR